jgi:hypothetical protein
MNCSIDPRHTKDITGQRFGRLRVLRFAGYRRGPNGRNSAWWETECEGSVVPDGHHPKQVFLPAISLRSGNTKSCGCWRDDATKARHLETRATYIGRKQKDPRSRLEIVGVISVGGTDKPTILDCICHGPHGPDEKHVAVKLSDFISERRLSCGCLWSEVRIATTKKRHGIYRVGKGYRPDQLMSDVSKAFRALSHQLRIQIFLRDCRQCLLCESKKFIEMHHLVPLQENLSLAVDPHNLATLCRECHRSRAHQGNVRGPVDQAVAQELERMVLEREISRPTSERVDLIPLKRQVADLFKMSDREGNPIPW